MTDEPSDSALSLEQIEHDVWGQPPADATRPQNRARSRAGAFVQVTQILADSIV
jgi:hypothetical protein